MTFIRIASNSKVFLIVRNCIIACELERCARNSSIVNLIRRKGRFRGCAADITNRNVVLGARALLLRPEADRRLCDFLGLDTINPDDPVFRRERLLEVLQLDVFVLSETPAPSSLRLLLADSRRILQAESRRTAPGRSRSSSGDT